MMFFYREKNLLLMISVLVGLMLLGALLFGNTELPPNIRMRYVPSFMMDNEDVKDNFKEQQNLKQVALPKKTNWVSESSYTVAVLQIPSFKPIHFQSNEHLKFVYVPEDAEPNEWWAKKGYLSALADFGYFVKAFEFEEYQESVSINWILSERLKHVSDDVDFVLITSYFGPSVNKTEIEVNLHARFDEMGDSINDICLIQMNKQNGDEAKKINVEWPTNGAKGISGLIIPRTSIKGIKRILYTSHYLNSFEFVAQHYCEVEGKPILLFPMLDFSPREF